MDHGDSARPSDTGRDARAPARGAEITHAIGTARASQAERSATTGPGAQTTRDPATRGTATPRITSTARPSQSARITTTGPGAQTTRDPATRGTATPRITSTARPSQSARITTTAQRLGISPRMLRYRESLGLLPAVRPPRRSRPTAPGARRHRRFTPTDHDAVALGLSIERRYDITPAALAFGLRVLADPRVRAQVTEFGARIGRIQPPPARALDFEQERALRLLRIGVPGRRN